LGPGGAVYFASDADDYILSFPNYDERKNLIFNSSHPSITCNPDPEDRDRKNNRHCSLKEKISVHIKSKKGFQVIYLRFIASKRLNGKAAAYKRYMVQATVIKCESINKPGFINADLYPPNQKFALDPFYPKIVPSPPSPHVPPDPSPGPNVWFFENVSYRLQMVIVVSLSVAIFCLLLAILNLDPCCEYLAAHMYDGDTITDSTADPMNQLNQELLFGLHPDAVGENSISMDEGWQLTNLGDIINPVAVRSDQSQI